MSGTLRVGDCREVLRGEARLSSETSRIREFANLGMDAGDLRPHLDAQAQQAAGQLALGGMDGDAI